LRLLFFDFGSGEIFIIVLAIILVFGPSKIPEIARGLGKFINEIKRASEDIKTEINREADKIDREKRLEKYKKSLTEKLDDSSEKETKNELQ
jgi:TatA/E family protein of Tat protein translocase